MAKVNFFEDPSWPIPVPTVSVDVGNFDPPGLWPSANQLGFIMVVIFVAICLFLLFRRLYWNCPMCEGKGTIERTSMGHVIGVLECPQCFGAGRVGYYESADEE